MDNNNEEPSPAPTGPLNNNNNILSSGGKESPTFSMQTEGGIASSPSANKNRPRTSKTRKQMYMEDLIMLKQELNNLKIHHQSSAAR